MFHVVKCFICGTYIAHIRDVCVGVGEILHAVKIKLFYETQSQTMHKSFPECTTKHFSGGRVHVTYTFNTNKYFKGIHSKCGHPKLITIHNFQLLM